MLQYKSAESCRFDEISLGEIMLRLDPGEGRIHTTRKFDVWEGGGEYNVARGLRRCFGLRTAVVTAFADNPVGRLVEDFILQGGVDTSFIRWVPFDGVGREVRNGLNFVERGFGCRGAKSCSDRGNTAVSLLEVDGEDMQVVFRDGADQVPADLPVLHASRVGRIHTLIMRMNAQEATERLAVYSPLLVDAVPLTLEEIFIYELGGADYAVKDLVL